MKQYESVYRNTGTTPRKMQRVEDYYPIQRTRTGWEDAVEFFVGAVIAFAFVVMFLAIGYGFMAWLEIVK